LDYSTSVERKVTLLYEKKDRFLKPSVKEQ
jgi:hypothetical protein